MCGFAGFSKNYAVIVFLVWFSYKLDTWVWVSRLYRFFASFFFINGAFSLLNKKAAGCSKKKIELA
jgi:hypothetical protein